MDKKGRITMDSAKSLILGLLGLILVLAVAAVGIPVAAAYGDDLCATGLPFSSFFKSDGGIVWLAVMGGLVVAVIATAFVLVSKQR